MSMIMVVNNAVISKGYEDQPAIRFNEKGNFAQFRFGNSKYDKDAPNNKRWINMTAKAFDSICERIKKMQLDEGAHVNLIGEYDEECWTDKTTLEQKTSSCLTLLHIEYAGGGKQAGNNGGYAVQAKGQGGSQAPSAPQMAQSDGPPLQAGHSQHQNAGKDKPAGNQPPQQMPESFEGYENFGGGMNPYFSES